MSKKTKISVLNGNSIDLHYWFDDKSHAMDAMVQNRCEYEVLAIIKEIASKFDLEITIETEPLAEGGLRRWFRIISKNENKTATITTAIVASLFTVIISSPLANLSDKAIDYLFEDKEIKALEKEKLELEVKKLRQDTQTNTKELIQSNLIKKRKSNFYEALEKYHKVDKVSFVVNDEHKVAISKELTVEKNNFKTNILVSDDLDPKEIDESIIEIVSPVLKKGNYKWTGIWNGEVISFRMKSKEFKILVQNGKVEFKNGSSINCLLSIRRKIDNEGKEKTVGFDVVRVNKYFENNKPVETPEGKSHRQKIDADKQQLKLFDTNKNEVK